MNFIDILIVAYLGVGAWDGYRRGFFQGLVNLLGFALGFWVALFLYHDVVTYFISPILRLSDDVADILAFVVIIGAIAIPINHIGRYLVLKYEKPSLIKFDEAVGSALGIFTSMIAIGIVLLFFSLLPQNYGMGPVIENSFLAPKIIKSISGIYDQVSDVIGPQLPRLVSYPEQSINNGGESVVYNGNDAEWRALEDAKCFNCGSHLHYEGLKSHVVDGEKILSPYYVCDNCGRHSDSCQSFEGYHKLYSECPALLAKKGYRLDCGMWPNGNFVKPKGTCPVEGNSSSYNNSVERVVFSGSLLKYVYLK